MTCVLYKGSRGYKWSRASNIRFRPAVSVTTHIGTNGAELQIYKLGKDNQGDLKSRTNETKLKICFTYLLMN